MKENSKIDGKKQNTQLEVLTMTAIYFLNTPKKITHWMKGIFNKQYWENWIFISRIKKSKL